ncbi:glutathione S-transferase [Xylaria palmicola]|nr:glutathione S-transferase [Xylaria palmicola]
MAASPDLPVVLYHYLTSPFAKRVVWYLTLRKIPYSECIQPRIMPRPDLVLLGVSYRRIPVLSIGRDVYVDSRLIFRKLEALYPPSAAHPGISAAHAAAGTPEQVALERLLGARATDPAFFRAFVQCMPARVFADPAFLRDRAAMNGIDLDQATAGASPFAAEALDRARPEVLGFARRWVRELEEGLLADGRPWILDSNNGNNGGPSLADIETAWLLHWITGAGALPPDVLGAESTPRVFAWLARFREAVDAAAQPATRSLAGAEAARLIAGSPFAEPEGGILREDPVVGAKGLAKGVDVRVWPTDYGFTHKDVGRLVAIDDEESVIEAQGEFGSVRIHAPRHGFTIAREDESAL